ncbi:MAG: hypothetical protein J7M34_12860, partial [Anaerolineae bacterium]|nr:hypothetical protein [Anaerolineae bacterium]
MSTARRILFLTPQLPYPPQQGTAIRNFNLLAHIARHYTVDLVTFLQPDDELSPDSPLHQLCQSIVTVPSPQRSLYQRLRTTLTSPLPDMALRLESPQMWRRLGELLSAGAYEVVRTEAMMMGGCGLVEEG